MENQTQVQATNGDLLKRIEQRESLTPYALAKIAVVYDAIQKYPDWETNSESSYMLLRLLVGRLSDSNSKDIYNYMNRLKT